MKKIGILATHPIQYHSPLFRELAKRTDLTVYYCCQLDAKAQGRGFGTDFLWDVPLLEGYRFEFLKNLSGRPDVDSFLGCDTPELILKIKESRFDLFITMGWYYKSAHQALTACRQNGIPIYARGDSQLVSRPFIVQLIKQVYFRSFLAKFDGFFSPGRPFERYLHFFGVPRKKIFFCPHFVDNDFFRSRRLNSSKEIETLRRHYGIGEREIVFLFCGKFISKKRPRDFLSALELLIKQNKQIEGILVGDGPLREELKRYSLKHPTRARFLGFLNQPELPRIYSISDCLILPSSGQETWGLVVNEAFACGIPAIVSNQVGCMEDLVDEGETGYSYQTGDIEGLVEKMMKFIEDKKSGRYFKDSVEKKIGSFTVQHAVDSILGRMI